MFESDWLLTTGPELWSAALNSGQRRAFRLSVLRLAQLSPHQMTCAPPLIRGSRSPFSSYQKIRESAYKKLVCLPHACALNVSYCNPFGTEKNYRKEERIHCRHVTCPTVRLSPTHHLFRANQVQRKATQFWGRRPGIDPLHRPGKGLRLGA